MKKKDYFKAWNTPKEKQNDQVILDLIAFAILNDLKPNDVNMAGNSFAEVDGAVDAELDDLPYVLTEDIRTNFTYRNASGKVTPLVFCTGTLAVGAETYDNQPAGMSMDTYIELLPTDGSELVANTWRSKKTNKVHISIS